LINRFLPSVNWSTTSKAAGSAVRLPLSVLSVRLSKPRRLLAPVRQLDRSKGCV